MSRTESLAPLLFTLTLLTALLSHDVVARGDEPTDSVDVVVYSGTPAGIAAAIRAAESGDSVFLIEPYRWVGGLITNGLSHADFRSFEGLTGSYLELTRRVRQTYVDRYGADSPQAQGNFRGTHAEPNVNLAIFESWIAEHPSIRIETETRLLSADVDPESRRVKSIKVVGPTGDQRTVHATTWIDASYEGDLMAAAGCRFEVGQESQDRYGESLAPEHADGRVQGYNFRLIVTDDADNQIPTPMPPGYSREDFLPLVELIRTGRVDKPFCNSSGDPKAIFKAHHPTLPNAKYDVNDVSRGAVRLSLPQINDAWPDGDHATRNALFAEHLRHQLGLLHFVQNDPEVPEAFRKLANEYRLCRDEFVATGGVPEQLYVREARRLVGQYVFTQNDVECIDGDARSRLQPDAIAIGDYGPNCHGTDHEGPRIGGKHVGEFYYRAPPYQIPLGVIQPLEFDNLLVTTACSASHVGFCALRLEPIWMALGDAAGVAARLSIRDGIPACEVTADAIRKDLHDTKTATLYLSDIDVDHDDFAATQWWGALGGFHGIADEGGETLPPCGTRGENILGQYFEAFPNHAAELDRPLTDRTRDRWNEIARDAGIQIDAASNATTRGDWIRSAYRQR